MTQSRPMIEAAGDPIVPLIEQALSWRIEHKGYGRSIEACAAALRAIALIDAYEAVGGDGSRWRKECGVLR